MLEMAIDEDEPLFGGEIKEYVQQIEETLEKARSSFIVKVVNMMQIMLFLTFHAGAGGTEAQDWCSMLIHVLALG